MVNSVSVVMTTYNGEKYIFEQLSSINCQTRKPDEVLILDDGSTDNTVGIIKNYIDDNKLYNWRLIINRSNLGWKRNFMKGFSLAKGDVIFCADQDDIWRKKKIEDMCNVLSDHKNIHVLACNIVPFYENGGKTMASKYITPYGQECIQKVDFFDVGFDVIRPGCAICFRKSILPLIDSIWFPELAHDAAIWMVGILTDSAYILNHPLMDYRRHGNNNSPSNAKTLSNRIKLVSIELNKVEKAYDNSKLLGIDVDKQREIIENKQTLEKRLSILETKDVLSSIGLMIKPGTCYGIRSWLADLISMIA